MDHEVTIIEQDRVRFVHLEEDFEHAAIVGDATELFVLERAGIGVPDLVVAVTGDDEDNMVICQMAREHFAPKVIAASTIPGTRRTSTCGISPTVSATRRSWR